jgi:hypothetical protein
MQDAVGRCGALRAALRTAHGRLLRRGTSPARAAEQQPLPHLRCCTHACPPAPHVHVSFLCYERCLR